MKDVFAALALACNDLSIAFRAGDAEEVARLEVVVNELGEKLDEAE